MKLDHLATHTERNLLRRFRRCLFGRRDRYERDGNQIRSLDLFAYRFDFVFCRELELERGGRTLGHLDTFVFDRAENLGERKPLGGYFLSAVSGRERVIEDAAGRI